MQYRWMTLKKLDLSTFTEHEGFCCKCLAYSLKFCNRAINIGLGLIFKGKASKTVAFFFAV